MRRASLYLTPGEAKKGCKKKLKLPGQKSPKIVDIQAGTQNRDKLSVTVLLENENGQPSLEHVQITVYIRRGWALPRHLNVALLLFPLAFLTIEAFGSLLTCSPGLEIAEIIYKIEPYFMFGSGLVISLLMWIIPSPPNRKSRTSYLMSAVVVFLFILGGFAVYVKDVYTYIPKVLLGQEPLLLVAPKFQDAGFHISDANYVFNESAKAKIGDGKEPFSYFFKVYKVTPPAGTFVCSNIDVELHITWDDTPKSVSFPQADIIQLAEKDIYSEVKADFIYSYNANKLTLFPGIAAAKMSIDGFGEFLLHKTSLGSIPVEASLINFDTGIVVDTQTVDLGYEITFNDIPDGTYYYVVTCDGYLAAIPDSPFKLERNLSLEEDVLSWSVDLEKEEALLSPAFCIRTQDADGHPIRNSEFYIRAVDADNPSPSSIVFSCQPLHSDDNGYLTFWYNTNNQDFYGLADFRLFDNCNLEVKLGEEGDFLPVRIDGELGICTIRKVA